MISYLGRKKHRTFLKFHSKSNNWTKLTLQSLLEPIKNFSDYFMNSPMPIFQFFFIYNYETHSFCKTMPNTRHDMTWHCMTRQHDMTWHNKTTLLHKHTFSSLYWLNLNKLDLCLGTYQNGITQIFASINPFYTFATPKWLFINPEDLPLGFKF